MGRNRLERCLARLDRFAPGREPRFLLRLVVASFAAVWLLCPSPASAAGRWLRSTVLSRPSDVTGYPQVASDGRGGALVVWSEILGRFNYVVRTSRQLRPGARWSPPVSLSPPTTATLAYQLAQNLRGAASVVWDQGFESTLAHPPPAFVGSSFLRTPGSAWSSARRVSPFSTVASATYAGVGVDARGDAIAVWAQELGSATTSPGGRVTIYAASARGGSERWSAPTTLDGPGAVSRPGIAVAASGVAVAVWLRSVSGGVLTGEDNEVFAAVRSARGRWGRAVSLGSEYEPPFEGSATTNAPGPRVAIVGAGAAIVVWQHRVGSRVLPEADVLDSRTMRWGLPKAIARSDAIDPAVALDVAGDATVAWTAPGDGVVTSSRRLMGGCSWTRPQTLVKAQVSIPFPQVAASPDGAAMIVWQGPVRAAVRSSPGSPWQRPATLSSRAAGRRRLRLIRRVTRSSPGSSQVRLTSMRWCAPRDMSPTVRQPRRSHCRAGRPGKGISFGHGSARRRSRSAGGCSVTVPTRTLRQRDSGASKRRGIEGRCGD